MYSVLSLCKFSQFFGSRSKKKINRKKNHFDINILTLKMAPSTAGGVLVMNTRDNCKLVYLKKVNSIELTP